MLAILHQLGEAKPGSDNNSKANGLLTAHFGDETFIHPEHMVISQPQKYTVTKFVTVCREFWNKPSR